jgi:RsiW-degrading membrane proteinase PrsW (M82 family)
LSADTNPTADPDRTTRFETSPASAVPEAEPETPSVIERLVAVGHRVSGAAKVDRLDADFSLRHLFANSFSRRSQEDVERELMVGTSATTPPITSVRAEWPQPWLFARTFVATGAVFALLFVGWTVFQSITLLPGLIIVGSFAMPTAVLIFFFEVNLPRNVSIVAVLRMVFLGGAASLLFSLIGFELFDFPWLGAMVAGLVEEPAKLLAVVVVARQVQHRYILNGMLFGAAIGAGFAAFESAGYALVAALFALDSSEVIDNIVLRGVFSPFAHVVWTAITAGALWRVTDGQPLRPSHLKDQRFWRIMVLAIGLHTIWNSPIPNLLYLKFALLGALAWLVCFSLLQEGIGQIRSRQLADPGYP